MDNPKEIYDGASAYLQNIRADIMNSAPFTIEPAISLVERIINEQEMTDKIFPLTMRAIKGKDYNIDNQINVTVYALKMGSGLGYSRTRMLELGLSALLHDIGMFRIPESIVFKNGPLTESEVKTMRTHAEIGKEIVSLIGENYPWLSDVVYRHHERENGEGYPQGLRGNEIQEYAKIVGLADCYEAMTHDRPYRKALKPSVSAKELITQKNKSFFPDYLLKVFIEQITLYPVGTYVTLNALMICEVVHTHSNFPLRPDVKILFDKKDVISHSNRIIQLKENPLFYITDCLPPEELTNLAEK